MWRFSKSIKDMFLACHLSEGLGWKVRFRKDVFSAYIGSAARHTRNLEFSAVQVGWGWTRCRGEKTWRLWKRGPVGTKEGTYSPDRKYGKRNKGGLHGDPDLPERKLSGGHTLRELLHNGSRGQGGWLGRQMYSHSKVREQEVRLEWSFPCRTLDPRVSFAPSIRFWEVGGF